MAPERTARDGPLDVGVGERMHRPARASERSPARADPRGRFVGARRPHRQPRRVVWRPYGSPRAWQQGDPLPVERPDACTSRAAGAVERLGPNRHAVGRALLFALALRIVAALASTRDAGGPLVRVAVRCLRRAEPVIREPAAHAPRRSSRPPSGDEQIVISPKLGCPGGRSPGCAGWSLRVILASPLRRAASVPAS